MDVDKLGLPKSVSIVVVAVGIGLGGGVAWGNQRVEDSQKLEMRIIAAMDAKIEKAKLEITLETERGYRTVLSELRKR